MKFTKRFKFRKPDKGELNWDIPLNENFDDIDNEILSRHGDEMLGALRLRKWLGLLCITTAERNEMIKGWGIEERGRIWYNVDEMMIELWDGEKIKKVTQVGSPLSIKEEVSYSCITKTPDVVNEYSLSYELTVTLA